LRAEGVRLGKDGIGMTRGLSVSKASEVCAG